MTDRQNDAITTLKTLAKTRAEYLRGGSTNFEQSHQPQIDVALRASGMTADEWESLFLVAAGAEAEQWEQKLIQAEETTAELTLERRRNR